MGALIRLYFWTKLRILVNAVQRLWKKEPWEKKTPLPKFDTPKDVETYVRARFQYRLDQTRIGKWTIPIDYVTHPEVFQTRLEDEVQVDGDCDDFHFWVAQVLTQNVHGVEWAYPLSVTWKGGGHTTCLYKYKGLVYLFNYDIEGPLEVEDAPRCVLEWHNRQQEWEGKAPAKRIFYYVLETVNHRLISATPSECQVPI